jgi:PAS domain S-box-containing protein
MKNEIESLRRQVEDLKAEIVRLQQELKTSQQRSAIFHEKDTHLDSETALSESEERLRVAIEAARIGTYITNLETDRVYWSPELCDILGVQPGIERTREEAFKVVHKDDIAHALTVGRLALDPDGDGCFESEHRVVRPDGQVRWILWRGRTIFRETESGRIPSKRIGACVDITERKQAEDALRESEERHRKIVETSSDAILLRSKEIIIYANPSALKLFRANHPGDLIGKRYLDLVHPDDRALTVERVKKTIAENWIAPPREHRMLALDGQVVYVESTGGLVKHRGETQIFGVFRDITERKRTDQEKEKLEAQLRQAQKMEAIGSLAGGIAHDFNNILSVIIGNAEFLEMTDISFSGKSELTQILTASQRAKQLVRQILAFSRQGEQQKLFINLKPMVKETLEFLRASLPSTIQLRHYITPDAGAIMADHTQMQQVLMNLCTNAAHAMEKEGGALKIELDTITIAAEDVQFDPETERGEYVRLTVSDTGHGIEPEVQPRIFDPYFTTKGPERGTGLGLSVVHGIVKSHGGNIKVYSEVGKGTVFRVLLPRVDGVEKKEEKPVQKLAVGVEKILLVDDEKHLADMYQKMLCLLGYQVETRTSPVEAVEAVRTNPQKYDLVITDMTMPQMTGYNLAKRLMEIRPGLPVILCTGFSDQVNEEKARSAGILAFLLKPLLFHDLANTLRKVLDETRKTKVS